MEKQIDSFFVFWLHQVSQRSGDEASKSSTFLFSSFFFLILSFFFCVFFFVVEKRKKDFERAKAQFQDECFQRVRYNKIAAILLFG